MDRLSRADWIRALRSGSMEAMKEDKHQLRERMLAIRRGLAPAAVAAKSEAIAECLKGLSCWHDAATVLTYVNVDGGRDNEVSTRGLIVDAMADGRQVLVPIALRGGKLIWSRLTSLDELEPSRFGVPEPRSECRRLVDPPPDALCLTPGIAFTPAGYRIGYGGGFYDRFLATFEGISVGLAFSEQMIRDFPRDGYDVPVRAIITDVACFGALAPPRHDA